VPGVENVTLVDAAAGPLVARMAILRTPTTEQPAMAIREMG
jgi:hypothetical protein